MDENLEPKPETETPPTQLDLEPVSPKPRGSRKWYIIGGVLVIVLAAAAFFGAQLLKSPMGLGGFGNNMNFGLSTAGGKAMSMNGVQIDMKSAPELPTETPASSGLFVRRQDQSIFIGTGRITMMIGKNANSSEAPKASGSYDGPVVEVVVNHQTTIYQDVTEMTPPDEAAAKGGTVSIQQIVKSGSLDDLGANSMVTVWGEKQGDRFIAKTLLFR
jgi:hypothetical protein